MRIQPTTALRLALLLSFGLLAPYGRTWAQGRAGQSSAKRTIVAVCTPNSVRIGNGPAQPAKNPIAAALGEAGPGSSIRLEPGTYPRFSIGFNGRKVSNAATSGGAPGRPIVVYSNGGARIHHQGADDTIAISSQMSPGHITFRNLQIVPGYRAGIMFYGGGPTTRYEGFRFHDCDILGAWNHMTDSGETSKWGLWGFGLADFEFRGVQRRAKVENIRREHGFYIQNPKGDVTLENIDGRFLGRTFCQFTARASDGPPGVGTLRIKGCRIEEVCIAGSDNFKGGSALTFAGRLTGPIRLEQNEVRIGFAAGVRKLTRPGDPYGTGALVAWDGGGNANGTLILSGNQFRAAPGCGDRPLVSIGGTRSVRIEADNEFSSDGDHPTLALDPVGPGGRLENSPIGELFLAAEAKIEGVSLWRGRPLEDPERARFGVPLDQRKSDGEEPAERSGRAEHEGRDGRDG